MSSSENLQQAVKSLWNELFKTIQLPICIIQVGLILGPANERRRYKVTPSLIGWAQT